MSDTAGSRRDAVDQLLLEAGLDDDVRLRPALLELRGLAGTAPEPSAAVAALMAGHAPRVLPAPDAAPAAAPGAARSGEGRHAAVGRPMAVDELAARRRIRRRATLTALSVVVSLAAGGAVAAASDQGIRQSFSNLNVAVKSLVTGAKPAGDGAERPAHQEAQLPAAPAPSPAVTPSAPDGGASQVPTLPAAGGAAAAKETDPAHRGGSPKTILPSELPRGLSGGVEQPQVPVHGSPDVPLPDALPEPPLP